MSIKNDALFHNRGGIMNRVKTQDAAGNDKQATPARQRQDKIAQKALAEMQEKSKNLTQSVLKVKKTISDAQDRTMSESELKLLEKQLDQLTEKYILFRSQIEDSMLQAAEIQHILPQMKQVEEKVFEQEIEVKIIKAVLLADQGCNHECIRELDSIMIINESRGFDTQSKTNTKSIDTKGKNHDSKTSDQLL